ncbi:MAG TPA: cysteine desulfurase [Acholeplasmataceae bacterium]|nr:cysteine desulfurase [Acholeplasmataceae bacterium]
MNIEKIRKEFSFFKANPKTHYLDSAATALKYDKAIKVMTDYYLESGVNIHRGSYKLSYLATKAYEEARETVAKFINANSDEIVFTKGATQALNLVANSANILVGENEEVITTEQEHNSSVLPWLDKANELGFEVKYIPLNEEYRVTVQNFKKVLKDKTKVVVINHVSNVLGYINPIKEITKLAHEKGAIVILDAAQSVANVKIDVKDLNVDFLAFSGHKIFGPNGIGVLYGKKELLRKLHVYEVGGEMVAKASKDNIIYQDVPFKFEAGTPPIAEALGLAEAIRFIESLNYDEVTDHIRKLKAKAVAELSKIEGVTIYNPKSDFGVISFNIDGVHPHDVSSVFDEYNVCIRSGHHCASLLTEVLGTPGGTVRASISIYNDEADINALIEATKKAVSFFGGYLK